MKLKDYIKQFRLEKNLTQRQFAELSGLDQARVSLLENANYCIGYKTIEKLAKATGKTPAELRGMLYDNNK